MSAEKKSRVELLEKKIFAITDILKKQAEEQSHSKTLVIGLLETVKLLNGYDEAIESLKEKWKNTQNL